MADKSRFYKIDPDAVAALIAEAAARYIVPRFNMLSDSEIRSKSSRNDLVTIADQETEDALIAELCALYPGALALGEETVSAGVADIKTLDNLTSSQPIFVIDPVDGTWNFVHGKREFCVMVACVISGETRFSWIYDVPDSKMMVAEKGAGAYFGAERLQVAPPRARAELSGHAGERYFPQDVRPFIKDYKQQIKELYSLGCAGHEYLRLASGLADFGIYSRARQWDHLAGALAVSEAGGEVTLWDGKTYRPHHALDGLLVTSNPALRAELQENLTGPMAKAYQELKY